MVKVKCLVTVTLISTSFFGSNTSIGFLELTDAIAEDWGGKPFVDMQKGWKYALAKYPEACWRTMKFALN